LAKFGDFGQFWAHSAEYLKKFQKTQKLIASSTACPKMQKVALAALELLGLNYLGGKIYTPSIPNYLSALI
jgi:hypothetical protein